MIKRTVYFLLIVACLNFIAGCQSLGNSYRGAVRFIKAVDNNMKELIW